jgi:hypothetical protein
LALFVAAGSLPLTIVLAHSGGGYNLEWNTFDAGGHTFSSGGGYTLGGTVGQPDAGTLSGGAYTLNGGFWNGLAPCTRYAAPTAQGSGNCSNWENACTLQTALARAVSGDEIWVQMGVHYPGAAGNYTATFTLKNGVALYGGFAGTETSRDERNWRANPTILSGDIDQNDNHGGDYINENASQIVGNNAYHVLTGSGTNSTAVLDGFIITAGQANGSSPHNSGGGMYNMSGSPTLTNVTFSGNSATYGGGMYNEESSPTLTNVTFSGNSTGYSGGGMLNYNNSNPMLTNVTFSGNSATYGGGMLNYFSSNPTLTNVILWGNSASNGPEIYNNNNSTPVVTYSDIQGCGGSGSWNPACGTDGGNNIDADPLFVDAAGGNLRLGFGSPAIESGTNTGCPTTDLDGLPRPADGNGDSTATCDMGAYEAGQMICNVAANTAYTFDKNSNVVIATTATLGNLSCLYVDEMELNHPNATASLQTGRYWLIRGLQSDKVTDATGFSVNLTLPTPFTADANDKVCRYTGNGQVWDCAMSSFTANSITRNGVSAFSDWTVGNNAGPTAVTLTSSQASSSPSPLVWLLPALLAMAVFFAKKRLAKP